MESSKCFQYRYSGKQADQIRWEYEQNLDIAKMYNLIPVFIASNLQLHGKETATDLTVEEMEITSMALRKLIMCVAAKRGFDQ